MYRVCYLLKIKSVYLLYNNKQMAENKECKKFRLMYQLMTNDCIKAMDLVLKTYPTFLDDMEDNKVIQDLKKSDPSITQEELLARAYALIVMTRYIFTQPIARVD